MLYEYYLLPAVFTEEVQVHFFHPKYLFHEVEKSGAAYPQQMECRYFEPFDVD